MPDVRLCQIMARYNRWMNQKLYAAAAELSDAERKADRGAFFKSIHTTLNHLLFGDRVWLSRFTGRDYEVNAIDEDIFSDFADLRAARDAMDEDLVAWAEGLTEDWLAGDLTWSSSTDNIPRTRPRWLLVSHLFNHQTHHRGQVTTLLTQYGQDVGTTDLPWMPEFGEP